MIRPLIAALALFIALTFLVGRWIDIQCWRSRTKSPAIRNQQKMMRYLIAVAACLAAPTAAAPMFGVNLGGLEAGETGKLGWTHAAPARTNIDLAWEKGMRLFRIPIRAPRIMPMIGGSFDPAELAALKDTTDYILGKGGTVLVDWHDFGASYGLPYGKGRWSVAAIVSLNVRILDAIGRRGSGRVIVGLQNEPFLAGVAGWWSTVQDVVLGLRRAGVSNVLAVSGANYAAAGKWDGTNGNYAAKFVDPLRRLVFETHVYFDKWSSGTASECVAGSANRLDPVLRRATADGYKVIVSEIAFSADASCNAVRTAALAKLRASNAVYGVTFWTLGALYPHPGYMFGLLVKGGGSSVLLDRIVAGWMAR
jgi:hypothetical protein